MSLELPRFLGDVEFMLDMCVERSGSEFVIRRKAAVTDLKVEVGCKSKGRLRAKERNEK
jgi:hypothetical protein